jgi:hypothetical protein
MVQPRRSKRFQMHLSTAMVLMFTAGGLLWANMNERNGFEVEEARFRPLYLVDLDEVSPLELHYNVYGWPFTAMRYGYIRPDGRSVKVEGSHYRPVYSKAAIDLAVAMVILFVVWYVSEWWIRRRANKA